jgi:hypothetical protein
MFRRRLLSTIAMIVLVTGVLGAGPARAQAPLGFTIAPTQGLPGDTVTGQVNVADVAASCVTDLAEFQARFQAVLDGPYAGGSNSGELFSRFFPGGEFVFENCDQAAYSLTGITVLGIGANIMGAAETALPQTFVMTFAEIATQQPVGELGHFDPATGAGSVVVPDVAPGPWAVAAACVGPVLDVDLLETGIRTNGAFLESLGFPTCDINSPEFAQFVQELLGPDADLFTFLNAFGPTFIRNIVTPDALGVQIFTVLAQPQTKADCKNGGWKNFPGLGFKNQGQCIKFVNTGQRPTTTTTAPTTTTTTTTSTTTTTMGSPSGAFLEDAPSTLE